MSICIEAECAIDTLTTEGHIVPFSTGTKEMKDIFPKD